MGFHFQEGKLFKKIHILSEQTIDQIAAGEVIENPASVVKELFENAVDAGASHIVIETLGGGFQSIRISDDGSGMSGEDALLCLKRHATSKIRSVGDLMQLHTMGFRGEALASIASISEMSLTTAMQEGLGLEVQVKGGTILSVQPSARSQGTTIEVRSLFYNVPARKKFQKTAAASSAEITRIGTLLALAHPHIGIELIQQRKEIFSSPSAKNKDALIPLLQKRCTDLLGAHFQSHMHTVHFQENGCEVHGLIGDPCLTRYNRSGQYLFINARPVHCLPLAFAIRDGYGTSVDTARHPIYMIHAAIDPALIDVNVHPQKKDIRLQEEEAMKRAMRRAISRALQSSRLYPNPNFVPDSGINSEMPLALEIDFPSSFHLRETADEPSFSPEFRSVSEPILEKQIPFSLAEEARAVGLFEHYLILEASSITSACFPSCFGIVWVDLLAAEARILFERLMNAQGKKETQGLLLPITFSCSRAEAEKLHTCFSELEQLGISLRSIGPTVFMVEAIPAFLEEKEIHAMLQAIASSLTEDAYSLSEKKMRQCAQTICRLSRSRTRTFSLHEGLRLFNELSKTGDPLHCPQGKPTIYHMRKDEIESHFQ
jgi:DNA mismatch repair protein MutL